MKVSEYIKPAAEIIDIKVEDIMLVSDESERDEILTNLLSE